MTRRLLMAMLIFAAACTAEPETTMPATVTDRTHPSGFVVPVPGGFRAREVAEQLVLDEEGDLRSPRRMVFELLAAVPPGLAKSRRIGASAVPYRVAAEPGGSGGDLYRLEAARPMGERWLRLRASESSERGEPDFALAWRTLEGARRGAP